MQNLKHKTSTGSTASEVIAKNIPEILKGIAEDLKRPDLTVQERLALNGMFLEYCQMQREYEEMMRFASPRLQ